MQKNIKKRGAIISGVVVLAALGVYICLVLFALVSESYGDAIGTVAVAIAVAILLFICAGVVIALRQRLRELDSGEEEDARKY